ncbi:MAG: ImmA/IrrE family metallo-endopeptidase [Peptococcaceae bacterium]|nr:ImmA/IrrE family metallo-endopeptidase [Peptococcaceae bacterium]
MALTQSTMKDEQIRACANEVRASAFDFTNNNLDVTALAIEHGFSVHSCQTKSFIQSFIIVDEKNEIEEVGGHRLIGYNEDIPLERRRRGIAHEIGHFFIHKGKRNDLTDACFEHATPEYIELQNDPEKREIDRQADLFARVLLMPAYQFAESMRKGLEGAGMNRDVSDPKIMQSKCERVFKLLGEDFVVTPKKIAQRIADTDAEIERLCADHGYLREAAARYVQQQDKLQES